MAKKVSGTLAIATLILNLIIPGLGTLVAGENTTGTIQFIMFLVGMTAVMLGAPLLVILVGIPIVMIGCLLCAAAWIWALITSIKLVKKA